MLTVCTSHTLHTFIAFTSMVYRVYQKVSSYKDKIHTPCSIKYVSYICTLSYLHYTTTLTLQQLVYFVVVKHILHTIYITCVCTKNKNKKSTAMYIVCNQTSKLQTMLSSTIAQCLYFCYSSLSMTSQTQSFGYKINANSSRETFIIFQSVQNSTG